MQLLIGFCDGGRNLCKHDIVSDDSGFGVSMSLLPVSSELSVGSPLRNARGVSVRLKKPSVQWKHSFAVSWWKEDGYPSIIFFRCWRRVLKISAVDGSHPQHTLWRHVSKNELYTSSVFEPIFRSCFERAQGLTRKPDRFCDGMNELLCITVFVWPFVNCCKRMKC